MKAKANNTKAHPENKKFISNKEMSFLCQCKNGHIFDYRKRIKYKKEDVGFAPCQGRCPYCKSRDFTFIGNGINVYPIKFNYTR